MLVLISALPIVLTSLITAEEFVRGSLRIPAVNLDQSLYVSDKLKTGRVMVKDEDVCVHCGLCAERCPTGAWDIQKFSYTEAQTLNSKDKKNIRKLHNGKTSNF